MVGRKYKSLNETAAMQDPSTPQGERIALLIQ